MKKEMSFPSNFKIWSEDGNWAGADTKRKIATILLDRKKPVCAKDIAKSVGVLKKTVVNAIGELRFLNNPSPKSKYAIRTYRNGQKFKYGISRKSEGKEEKRILGRFAQYTDNYYKNES